MEKKNDNIKSINSSALYVYLWIKVYHVIRLDIIRLDIIRKMLDNVC